MRNLKSPLASEQVVKTTCKLCDQDCGINVYVEEGRIVRVEGMAEHPVNKGLLCRKGMAAIEYVYSPDRLKHPLKREGQKWIQIPWDEALNTIARKLEDVKATDGARAIAICSGMPLDRSEAKAYIERFCDVYGIANYFSVGSFCTYGRAMGYILTYGSWTVADCQNSECILVWAKNPHKSAPPMAKPVRDAKKRGAQLIVIDPVSTPLAKKADLYLRIRPGTDCALALAMLNVIISENLYDSEFVERWTVGFEKLAEHVKGYVPEKVEKITWVPADLIRETARMYANTKPASILQGNALDQSGNGVQSARAIAILQAVTGNLDVPGGNTSPPPFRATYLRFPGMVAEKPLGADRYPQFFKSCREGQLVVLPEALLSAKPYPLKAMIISGSNPVLTSPNSEKVKQALRRLDFLVVMDLFVTETAELADIVLPAASYLERTELRDYELLGIPHVILRKKAIEVEECWPDWRFWFQLAKRLGCGKYFPWEDEKEAINHLLRPTGITIEQLKENPSGIAYGLMKYRGYEEKGFRTPSRKVELYSERLENLGQDPLPTYYEPAESPLSTPDLAKEYPLILTTGSRMLQYYHSQLHNIPRLRGKSPQPVAEVHPDTAGEYGINDGEMVILEAKRGSIKIKAKVTEDIAPTVVSIPHGWSQANANVLTDDKPESCDPISGFPAFKALLCRVSKG